MTARDLGYHLGYWSTRVLPEGITWRLAELVADVQWRRAVEDRAAVCSNLSLALHRQVDESSWLVRDVFRNFGRYLVEWTGHRGAHRHVTIEGVEHIIAARSAGRGIILLSAHLGNWELLGQIITKELALPLSAVVLPHDNPYLNGLFVRTRQRHGIRVIPLGSAAIHACLHTLRHGGTLGLIGE